MPNENFKVENCDYSWANPRLTLSNATDTVTLVVKAKLNEYTVKPHIVGATCSPTELTIKTGDTGKTFTFTLSTGYKKFPTNMTPTTTGLIFKTPQYNDSRSKCTVTFDNDSLCSSLQHNQIINYNLSNCTPFKHKLEYLPLYEKNIKLKHEEYGFLPLGNVISLVPEGAVPGYKIIYLVAKKDSNFPHVHLTRLNSIGGMDVTLNSVNACYSLVDNVTPDSSSPISVSTRYDGDVYLELNVPIKSHERTILVSARGDLDEYDFKYSPEQNGGTYYNQKLNFKYNNVLYEPNSAGYQPPRLEYRSSYTFRFLPTTINGKRYMTRKTDPISVDQCTNIVQQSVYYNNDDSYYPYCDVTFKVPDDIEDLEDIVCRMYTVERYPLDSYLTEVTAQTVVKDVDSGRVISTINGIPKDFDCNHILEITLTPNTRYHLEDPDPISN